MTHNEYRKLKFEILGWSVLIIGGAGILAAIVYGVWQAARVVLEIP